MKFRLFVITAAILLLPVLSLSAQNTDKELLEQHVYTLASDDLLGRGFGSETGNKAAEYIVGQFKAAGIEPLLDTYYHHFSHRMGSVNIDGKNVVGVVRGNDPVLKDEFIILGAHYDHIGWKYEGTDTVVFNGADDNASGVSAVIELGRYFAAHQSELKRSVILMAFDGEESGLIGSKWFVKDTVVEYDKIKAMFSLDMVGMYDKHGGLELGGIELLENSESLVERASSATSIIIKGTNDEIQNRTDTAPFGKVGIPAIYVNTGIRESEYHKPEDDADIIDYDGMVVITDFMTELVLGMSQADELIPAQVLVNIEKSGGMKRFHVGAKMLAGSSYFDYPDSYFQSKTIFSGGAGLFMELRLAQFLTLQPEVYYMTTGGEQLPGNLRTHEVTVPVSLLFTSPDPEGNQVRGYFQVGGYYSYSFAGAIAGTAMDFTNEYNQMTYGLVLGGGMEVYNLRMGYTAIHSLSDLMQTAGADGNIRLMGNYFTIGWAF